MTALSITMLHPGFIGDHATMYSRIDYRFASACHTGRHGRRGKGPGNKRNPAHAQLDQMFARQVASHNIVDPNEIKVATQRKWHEIAIEKQKVSLQIIDHCAKFVNQKDV